MKPGDHPEFYRIAPPPGASRDSSITLDREGRFWHEGELVENRALEWAMRTWIARHPDDGRLILTNNYDWCYFCAEDAPFIVDSLRIEESGEGGAERVFLRLFDGTEELLDPETLCQSAEGIVYARVRKGRLETRFSRHAQLELAPLLISGDPPTVRIGSRDYVLPPREPSA